VSELQSFFQRIELLDRCVAYCLVLLGVILFATCQCRK